MAIFEKVKRFENEDIALPVRKTGKSAGYDFVVAEDIVVPSITRCQGKMQEEFLWGERVGNPPVDLTYMAWLTKKAVAKPTLVSTGVKCKMEDDQYLELMARSSTPLKYWLIVANAPGIVDADYYGNESNDGEIFFQMINLSPIDIQLKKGDIIGQGIIKRYEKIDDDGAEGARTGGFGSTK